MRATSELRWAFRMVRVSNYSHCPSHWFDLVIVIVAVAVWRRLPLTPVILRMNVLRGDVALVFTVSVEELAEAGFGLKVAVTPLGSPLALSVTAAEKPPVRVVLTV